MLSYYLFKDAQAFPVNCSSDPFYTTFETRFDLRQRDEYFIATLFGKLRDVSDCIHERNSSDHILEACLEKIDYNYFKDYYPVGESNGSLLWFITKDIEISEKYYQVYKEECDVKKNVNFMADTKEVEGPFMKFIGFKNPPMTTTTTTTSMGSLKMELLDQIYRAMSQVINKAPMQILTPELNGSESVGLQMMFNSPLQMLGPMDSAPFDGNFSVEGIVDMLMSPVQNFEMSSLSMDSIGNAPQTFQKLFVEFLGTLSNVVNAKTQTKQFTYNAPVQALNMTND